MGSDQSIIDANLPTTNVGLQTPVMAVARTAAVILRGVTLRGGSNVGLNDSAGRSEGGDGGINNAGTLVLEDSVVTENYTRGVGGGIYNQRNLTLTRTTVSRNIAAGGGGGLYVTYLTGTCQTSPCRSDAGMVTMTDSTISGNASGSIGGGIGNYVGILEIATSTISGNQATGPGGAIYNSAYDANLTNVTISGNRGMNGGGIFNVGSGSTVRLSNVTIFNNLARYEGSNPNLGAGGGVVNQSSATMLVANTIIAGNVAGSGSGPDCDAAGAQAALTSQGYNLLQSASFCTVGVTSPAMSSVDPLLTPLEDNGGFTLTHALAPGSPAIDTGSTVLPGSGGGAARWRISVACYVRWARVATWAPSSATPLLRLALSDLPREAILARSPSMLPGLDSLKAQASCCDVRD